MASGIGDKKVVFCGAGNVGNPSRDPHLWSPRTTMGKIVERAIGPLGYQVQKRNLFREVFIPYSYDPATAAHDYGIPLHPGAERYYEEVGYPR